MMSENKSRRSALERVAAWMFDRLASIELAVFVILAIAAVSAVGTVVEAKHGASVAALVVYRSWYFSAILVLFMLNLAFAAFSRWPWRRHHIGFLVTHLGLIILIVGAIITRYSGIDGTIALGPGESARSVRLDTNYLNLFVVRPGTTYERLLSEKIEFNPLQGFPGAQAWRVKGAAAGAGLELRLLDWWPRANRVVGVKADPEGKVGVPAVHFRLMGSRANVEEWLFLNGLQGSTLDLGPAFVRFQRGKPALDVAPEKRTLFIYFLKDTDTRPRLAQVAAKSRDIQELGPVTTTQPVRLGWMDFEFLLEAFHQRVSPVTNYVKTDKAKGAVEAVRVALGNEERWLEMGASAQIVVGESIYFVQYTKQEVPLGFEIGLNRFDVTFYQGSRQPKSYESRVRVPGKSDDIVISMNEPLDHNGYTFYQSSYSMDEEGNPTVSVLSVNHDPGRWVKYLGSLMLTLGILLMFYFKPVYSGRSKWLTKKPEGSAL